MKDDLTRSSIQDAEQEEVEIEKAMWMYQAYPCLRTDIDYYIKLIKNNVIGQEKVISDLVYVAYYNQYINFLEEYMETYQGKRKAMLMISPTGTGKSTMLRTLEKAFDVPVYRTNITAVTSAGYIGEKVESMLEGLLQKAGGDKELAERGILLIDEIDKKITSTTKERDVAGKAVQQELLKIFEDSTVSLMCSKPSYAGANTSKGLSFKTGKLTIILAGACVGLDEIRQKRLNKSKIGFAPASDSNSKADREYSPQDLIEYGFIPELVGRIDFIEEFKPLKKQDLIDIIYFSEESTMQEACNILKSLGIEKIVIDPFIWERIIKEADIASLGVRGLNNKIDKLFVPIIKEAFRHINGGGKLNIDFNGNYVLEYPREGATYRGKCIDFKEEYEEGSF